MTRNVPLSVEHPNVSMKEAAGGAEAALSAAD